MSGGKELDREVVRGIKISTHISRDQYTDDPELVLSWLDWTDPQVQSEAARWAGFHERDQYRRPMVQAILKRVGDHPDVHLGRERAAQKPHKAPNIRPGS